MRICCVTGALAITEVLNAALFTVDPNFTKTTLEHVERQLDRHLSHLAAQQTATAQQRRPEPLETEPVAGPSGIAVSFRPMVSVEDDSSPPSGQYATAVSLSSLEVEDLPSVSSFFQPANGNNDQLLETAI